MTHALLTMQECAELLHCSRSAIYRMLKLKQIPALKIGSDWRFVLEELERWMSEGGCK